MKKLVDEIMQGTVDVLERWAMMMVEPVKADTSIFETDLEFFSAELRFHGLVSGRWVVFCQKPFLDALTSNLLGEPEEGVEADNDALRELVNVISGNLLTLIYGPETVFDLTSPHARALSKEEVGEMFEQTTICLNADDTPVGVSFVPEKVAP